MKESSRFRDQKMEENINWLVNDLYKDKKIIIWGHDYHISKMGSAHYPTPDEKCAVELLPQSTKDEMLSISLNFMKNAEKDVQTNTKHMSGNVFFLAHPEKLKAE